MSNTADIGIRLNLDGASQVSAGLGALAQGFDAVKGKAESVASAIGGIPGVLAALTGVASVSAFAGILRGSIESAAALNDLSIQTGATVEALSGLAGIGKLSGQSAESIAQAMNKLASNMAGASEESRGAGKALEAMGLSLAQIKSLSPEAQMQAIAGAMDNFSDGSGKAAAAMALFGKEGAKMLPFFKDLASVTELSAKVTAAQAAAADNLSDNLTRLQSSSGAWAKELSVGMIPALDQGAQFMLEMLNASGGLRDEVRKLSADGSIEEWTTTSISALLHLIDVVQAVVGVVRQIPVSMAVVMNDIQYAVNTALITVGSGFTEEGKAALKALSDERKAFMEAVSEDTQKNLFPELISDRFAASIKKVKDEKIKVVNEYSEAVQHVLAAYSSYDTKTQQAAMKALRDAFFESEKKGLAFSNTSSGGASGVEKVNPQINAYRALIAAINEKIAANTLEAESDKKLTEVDKLRLDIARQVEKGTLSAADASSEKTQALLAEYDAAVKSAEAEKTLNTLLADSAKQRADTIEAAQKQAQALQEQTAKQVEANEAIGLTGVALAELEARRLDEQAAAKDSLANLADEIDATGELSKAYREQAKALRDLGRAKTDGARQQVLVDEAKKATEEWKKASQQIENTLTDALMRGFESGKGFAQTLRDTVANMFKTLVLRPIVSAIVSPVAGALTGALGFAGAANAATAASGVSGAAGLYGMYTNFATSATGMALGLSEATTVVGSAAADFAATTATTLTTLGAAVPWVAAALAVAAIFSSKSTPHAGGIASYSSAGGLQTSTEHGAFGSGFGGVAYGQEGMQLAAGLASGITGVLDDAARKFGKKAGYEVTTAFADDSSKDGAWGALAIKVGEQVVLNWDSTRTSKWAPKEFADGSAGAEQYTAAVGKSVRDVMLTIVPEWAQSFFTALGDNPTLAQVSEAYAKIEAFSMQVVGLSDDTLNGIFTAMLRGEKTASETGAALADAITTGVRNSIAQAGAQAMTDVAKQYMVMPLVNAIMSGGDLKAALASIDFEKVGQVMSLISSGTMELLNAGDWEGFKAAVAGTIKATDGQAAASTDAAESTTDQAGATLKLADALKGTISASVRAASGLDDVAAKLRAIGLAALSIPTPNVPSNTPAAAASDARAFAASLAGPITEAIRGQGGTDLASNLAAILAMLKGKGIDTEGSSYLNSLASIVDTFKAYKDSVLQASTALMNRELVDKALQESGYFNLHNISVLGNPAQAGWAGYENAKIDLANQWQKLNEMGLGNFSGWQDVAGLSPEALKALVEKIVSSNQDGLLNWLSEHKNELAGGPMEGYANAIEEYQKQLAELQAQMQEQANNILDPLRADIAGQTEDPFARIAKQAEEYIKQLDALGQATAENTALVEQWREVMQQNTRDDLYGQLLSEAERNALSMNKLKEQFAALGVEVPTSTDAFRHLLDGLDTSTAAGRALYDALLQLIPGFVELTNAAGGAGSALAATNTAYEALQRAVDAQKKALQTQAAAARSLVNDLEGVFSTIQSAVRSLRGDSNAAAQAAAGRAFITDALATAKATGLLPDQEELAAAIQAVTRGLDQTQYASAAEAEFARTALAGQLEELGTLTNDQLTIAEQQLEATTAEIERLDGILLEYKQQIDAIRGVDTSVQSVAEAIAALTEAILAEMAASSGSGSGGGSGGGPGGGQGGGTGGGSAAEQLVTQTFNEWLGRNPTQAGIDYWLGTGLQGNELVQAIINAGIANGENIIPHFAVGTNRVPRNTLAMVHEGEAIIPKAFNPWAGGKASGDASRLERLVEGLTAEVQRLQAVVAEGNDHQRRSADLLDAVTEGGNAIRADVVATV